MNGELLRLLFLQAHRETTAHFNAAGLPSQQNRSENAFRFKRAAFYMGLKSKVGLVAAKASALWINLNLSPSFYFLFLQEQKKGIIIISARWAD